MHLGSFAMEPVIEPPRLLVPGADARRTWFVHSTASTAGGSGTWQRLRLVDQERLEVAVDTDAPSRPSTVVVDDGRSEVRLADRVLVDRYLVSPPRPPRELRRAYWAYKDSDGRWTPFDEHADARIEDAYRRLLKSTQETMFPSTYKLQPEAMFMQAVQFESGVVVQVWIKLITNADTANSSGVSEWEVSGEMKDPRPQARPAQASWLQSLQSSFLGTSFELSRGISGMAWQDGEDDEQFLSKEHRRVYLLVHGISDKLRDEVDVDSCISTLRRNLHKTQFLIASSVQPHGNDAGELPFGGPVRAVPRDEVLEVSWRESVHKESFDDRLQHIVALSESQALTEAHCAMADSLLYMQSAKRVLVLKSVLDSVEYALERFKTYNPGFNGDVVLIGHSVAGAALFHLLRDARLSFQVEALFTFGSPLGLLLHCSDEYAFGLPVLPGVTQLYNVFCEGDPAASRLEPSLFPEQAHQSPEPVPSMDALLKSNPVARIDWVLRDDLATTAASVSSLSTPGVQQSQQGAVLPASKQSLFARYCQSIGIAALAGIVGRAPPTLPHETPTSPKETALNGLKALGTSLFRTHDAAREQLRGAGARGIAAGLLTSAAAGGTVAASGVANVVSRTWEETGAADVSKRSGATDLVGGTVAAAQGVVGTARAVGGAVRLVGSAWGAAGSLGERVSSATRALTPPKR